MDKEKAPECCLPCGFIILFQCIPWKAYLVPTLYANPFVVIGTSLVQVRLAYSASVAV